MAWGSSFILTKEARSEIIKMSDYTNNKLMTNNEHNNEPFGYLMTLDLYGCKEGVCDDLNLCYQYLEDLVNFLKMTKQSPAYIFRSPDQFPDKAGLSGWIPLIESGIQMHTLTPKNFISIDVYSCREFDRTGVQEFTAKYFAPKEIEENFILRGIKYNQI